MPQRIVIDLVSFLLGFVSASIFWWLARAIKVKYPNLKERLKQQAEIRRQRKLEGISRFVRQETLRRAQASHLAHHLFSLDQVLIPPRLLAPPDYLIETPRPLENQRISNQLIPYLPDWPELSAPFPVFTLTLAQALSEGARIAITGEPGAGRSVTLAHLAMAVAQRDPAADRLEKCIPILLHAEDMELDTAGSDPNDLIRRCLSEMVPIIYASQLPKFTRELLADDNALLLIDGMDELPFDQLKKAAAYLQVLLEKYPKIRIAVTASADGMDGLIALGFIPLTVAAWSSSERQTFIQKWSELWNLYIAPEVKKRHNGKQPDTLLLSSWLTADPILETPLESTLKVWATFSGDMKGTSSSDAILAYVLRLKHKNIPLEALAELAQNLFCSGLSSLPYELVEKALTKYKPDTAQTVEETSGEETKVDSLLKKAKKPGRISSGSSALGSLLDSGLLVESSSGKVRFGHVRVAGFLACTGFSSGQELPVLQSPPSPLQMNTLRYLAVQGKVNGWVKKMLDSNDAPLYRSFLTAARWLPDAPSDTPWRSPLIRLLVQMASNERTAFHLRARCIAALVASNDSGVPVLLKQLLEAESGHLRRLAAIGCGASQQPKTTLDLIKHLDDPDEDVARAACLSLGAFGTRLAFDSMVDLLKTGQEKLQLAAAETLAIMPGGLQVLKEAAFSEVLLVRRAAIAGLSHIQTNENQDLLEKIAIEDGQWIIRNSAAEALAALKAPHSNIPRPLPPPDHAAWLLQYASQHGRGIVPGEPVTEYLLSALKDGKLTEQIHALQYLRSMPVEAVTSAVYTALLRAPQELHEAAYYALWQLTSSGCELPDAYLV
jgi:HEAT repeat protein